MRRRRPQVKHLVALVVALAIGAAASAAQAPKGATQLTPGAVADSLAVLRAMDARVHADRNDAAAWYRRGMVAWALTQRARAEPPVRGLDWTRLGRMADTSLRLAAEIAPDSAMYRLMAGRYLLASGVSTARAAAYGFVEAALEAARNSDSATHAEVAIEVGRLHWRRYDAVANRWMTTGAAVPCMGTQVLDGRFFIPTKADSAERLAMGRRIASSEMLPHAFPLPFDAAGELDYLHAEEFFREAFAAQRSLELAFRQLAMLLLERQRWGELAAAAFERVQSSPNDAWAWLALGLSKLRTGEPSLARAAFDRGFAALDPAERRRLDRLERVLPRRFAFPVSGDSAAMREAMERLYWLSADPLWSRGDAEPRLEFLARVTHAELRWSVGEMGVRGADSDRGEIFIRFGPPDLEAHFGLSLSVCILWVYDVGFVFNFTGQRTYATAMLGGDEVADAMIAASPARWDNLALPDIDSIPSRSLRFRAGPDSVDLVVAALPPIDSIRRAADVRGAVRTDFWILAGGLRDIAHDVDAAAQPGVRVYSRRVPLGHYVYRIEASADGSNRAGRASAVVTAGTDTTTGFAPVGFGMSDLLVATRADTRTGAPRRWSDLAFDPLIGSAASGAQLALVWETYDLGARDGTAHYGVTVIVERERSVAGRIAARIATSVAGRVGLEQTDDRVTMSFERTAPAADGIVLDNVALALGETPRGSYVLTVRVTDRVSGRATARSTRFVIR